MQKLYVVYENPEAIGLESVKRYVEIELRKEDFVKRSSEELFKQYFEPGIEQLKQCIEDEINAAVS